MLGIGHQYTLVTDRKRREAWGTWLCEKKVESLSQLLFGRLRTAKPCTILGKRIQIYKSQGAAAAFIIRHKNSSTDEVLLGNPTSALAATVALL